MKRSETGRDLNVLDGLALVMGSAIASVHTLRVIRSGLSAAGWVMICLMFACIALTATGQFIFLTRRFWRRLPGYPLVGDSLWAILGVPWLITALIESVLPGDAPSHNPLFEATLVVTLAIACLIAVVVVWTTWVIVPPGQAIQMEAVPWTSRVGLALSIAWPIQCGICMVVLS
jgi:hypothetical protein